MAPLVSIVTVSLNAVGTIEDTLASVSLQRRGFSIEHICVDGGSTDATRTTIDAWAERYEHVRRIYERDRGIYDAMNKGLRAASGQYVMFLNADDFLVSPDTLATVLAGIDTDEHRNPDLIVGDVAMGTIGAVGVWRHRRVPRLLQKLRGAGLFTVHQGVFAKRRLLEEVGGFDANLRISSDTNQYYDLERKYPLTMRIVPVDVAFMRAGGAANSGWKAMNTGTGEVYRHLRGIYGPLRATSMTLVKTLQSLTELRWGRCPHERWFSSQC